jgi:hypothetical protein
LLWWNAGQSLHLKQIILEGSVRGDDYRWARVMIREAPGTWVAEVVWSD